MTAASTPKGEHRPSALIEAAYQLLLEGGVDTVRHRPWPSAPDCRTTGWRPYLRPLVHSMQPEFQELLTGIFARSGFSVDPKRLKQLIALVNGAVVNALVDLDPDPRAATQGDAARRAGVSSAARTRAPTVLSWAGDREAQLSQRSRRPLRVA